MKLEGYKSGIYMRMNEYNAFILSKLNYDWSWEDPILSKLSVEASRQIGELNGYTKLLPNVDAYIKMLLMIEANKTSKIEGTDIKIEECLLELSDIEEEKKEAWERVQKYNEAMEYAREQISNEAHIDSKLLREIHKILLINENVDPRDIGKLRGVQTWVGGEKPADALYVPPPHTEILECLTDFEQFIENDAINTPDIVKIALLHYQFESIHPFVGGNGRIGRMIIPLYLQSKGILDKSCLFISEYLEQHKDEYFDKLAKVRTSSNIIGWINFFLESVIETAKMTNQRLQRLAKLKEEMDQVVLNTPVKPDNAKKIVNTLYQRPIIDMTRLGEISKVKEGTMRTIINSLLDKGIAMKTKGVNKNKIIVFKRYTDELFNIDMEAD